MLRRVGVIGSIVLISVLALSILNQCSLASTANLNDGTTTAAPNANNEATAAAPGANNEATVAAPGASNGATAAAPGASSGTTATSNPCSNTPNQLNSLTPQVPSDFTRGNPSQVQADCFAWQEFIALNWAASPTDCGQPDPAVTPAQFGTPNNTDQVVWESYKVDSEIFRPKGQAPTPWCADQSVPNFLAPAVAARNLAPTSSGGYKILAQTTKFGADSPFNLVNFTQAFTDSWLTAQSGNLTMYEVRLNQTEFTYITTTQTYDASIQQKVVVSPGLILPNGSIEVKAAWIELDDPKLWPSFKTSKAVVFYPWAPQTPVTTTMGLVGLHIIQKTPFGQQFVWATFEHVNNAPSTADTGKKLKDWYTYYNKNCNPSTDHYKCQPNYPPTPNVDPYNAPVQVMRLDAIDTNATSVNQYAWSLIKQANPNSVYLNYQLVNVLWPNSNTTVPVGACTGNTMPIGDPQPTKGQLTVANTTLETYFQQQKMCLDCHRLAPVALSPASGTCSTAYASDYSFLFSSAQSSSGN